MHAQNFTLRYNGVTSLLPMFISLISSVSVSPLFSPFFRPRTAIAISVQLQSMSSATPASTHLMGGAFDFGPL